MSRPRLIALLLALVTLTLYLPVTRHQFLNYDDDEYITDNSVVQNGLTPAGLAWAFTTGCASNWHPLTWLSHMADCTLFGLNPGAQHLVNVMFHAANTALLFGLWLRLTGRIRASALVAALFAWHPLHVESVAWIAERKDVLSTFLALLAWRSYVNYVQAGARRSYGFALIFFALGLMAKPMLVTLPFVLLLLDYWPLRRFSPAPFRLALLTEKIPFLILTTASCVATFLAQRHGHAVASLNQVPMGLRLANATVSLLRYLEKLIWPDPLAVIYPLGPLPATTLAWAAAILILVSAAVWHARQANRCWLVGWLWFLGTLVPVIGIVQVGSAAMADRYTYIPSIGILAAIVFGLPELAGKFSGGKKILTGAALLLLGGSIGLMERQLHFWRDTETLFRHTLAVTQDNDMAHLNLAIALDQQGRSQEALVEYREALRIAPERFQIHFNIGRLREQMGQPADALAEYQAAIRADPKVALWHCAAGSALIALGRSDAGLEELTLAGQLKPDYAQPHLESAKCYFQRGQDARAVDELHLAVQAEPKHFPTLATAAHYLAANENAAARDGRTAWKLASQADEISGHVQPMVLDALAMACAETGDYAGAEAGAKEALELAEAANLPSVEAIRRRLALYQNRQPWRESFRATNAPTGR